jgi:FkbM family methyltransferase
MALPRLVLEECRHGRMLFFPDDQVIGRSLRVYGEWAEHELHCLRPYLPSTGLILDVGAHLGTHSLAFARWCPGSKILAFEAQPEVAALLRVNALLNGLDNIETHELACAGQDGWCHAPSAPEGNLGSLSLVESAWRWLAPRPPRGAIRLARLDDLLSARDRVDFVKMDIERMEVPASPGAMQTSASWSERVVRSRYDLEWTLSRI